MKGIKGAGKSYPLVLEQNQIPDHSLIFCFHAFYKIVIQIYYNSGR